MNITIQTRQCTNSTTNQLPNHDVMNPNADPRELQCTKNAENQIKDMLILGGYEKKTINNVLDAKHPGCKNTSQHNELWQERNQQLKNSSQDTTCSFSWLRAALLPGSVTALGTQWDWLTPILFLTPDLTWLSSNVGRNGCNFSKNRVTTTIPSAKGFVYAQLDHT